MTATIETATKIALSEAAPRTGSQETDVREPSRAGLQAGTLAAVVGLVLLAAVVASLFIW